MESIYRVGGMFYHVRREYTRTEALMQFSIRSLTVIRTRGGCKLRNSLVESKLCSSFFIIRNLSIIKFWIFKYLEMLLELDLSKHINIYALFVLSLVESRCQSIGYKTIH